MKRVVFDTNLLVGAAYAEGSASRRLLDACARGELTAVVSPALRAEYERILPRAAWDRGFAEILRRLLERAEVVEPAETPRLVPEDPDDDKLLAAALAAGADAVLTNDRHLLRLDPVGEVRVLRPGEFWRQWSGG